MANVEAPVALHVLTGFLGSGKTTLLQRCMRAPSMADTAVVINEFGEIGLDHRLVSHVREQVVMLAGGCACCNVREDMRMAIVRLLAGRKRGETPPFKRIVLETSGVADPAPILFTIQSDYVLREYLRLGRIVATVDGVNGSAQLATEPDALKQVTAADYLVMTKGDIAAPDRFEALRNRLGAINPVARCMDVHRDEVDARLFLEAESEMDIGGSNRPWPAAIASPEAHGSDIRSFTLTYETPIDWTVFSVWLTLLLARHGERILRVKGILAVRGAPTPLAIHGVRHIMHPPAHLPAWPDEDRRSHVVFIVKGVERSVLRASLDVFQQMGDRLRPQFTQA